MPIHSSKVIFGGSGKASKMNFSKDPGLTLLPIGERG